MYAIMSRRGRRRNVGVVRVEGVRDGERVNAHARGRVKARWDARWKKRRRTRTRWADEGENERVRTAEGSEHTVRSTPPRCLASGSVSASHRRCFALLLARDSLRAHPRAHRVPSGRFAKSMSSRHIGRYLRASFE